MTTRTPHVVVIDGMNFIHRARKGFTLGPYCVVYNFVRNLRALVERLEPTRLIMVMEGHPKVRHALSETYKANRVIEVPSEGPPDEETVNQLAAREDFLRQAAVITALVARSFPIDVVRHADHECDDVIYNLIKVSSNSVPWTVVSNDSDFTQLLNDFDHVKVYNPMLKEYVVKPDYDYVVWKALRGDASDNVSSVAGINDDRATELVNDPVALREYLNSSPEVADKFLLNHALIKFQDFTEEEAGRLEVSQPVRDWKAVERDFASWSFHSMLKDKAWNKFVETFDPLWGGISYAHGEDDDAIAPKNDL